MLFPVASKPNLEEMNFEKSDSEDQEVQHAEVVEATLMNESDSEVEEEDCFVNRECSDSFSAGEAPKRHFDEGSFEASEADREQNESAMSSPVV